MTATGRGPPLFGQVVPGVADPVKKAFDLGAFRAGFGRLQFAQQFLLPRGQLFGRLYLHFDHQIASAAPLQHGHARAAFAQLFARLDAGRDFETVARAVDPGKFDRAAKGRGGERDRQMRYQRGAIALKHLVRLYMQKDVQIARR